MARVLLDKVIETDYGQFDLMWGGDDYYGFDGNFDTFFAGQVNGLVGSASGQGLYMHFGRRSGGSALRIVLHDDAATLDSGQWEDVVEVSIVVPPGARPRWCSWAGMSSGRLRLPAGTYRVRVSARGRDAGHDGEFADSVVDFYLVELWPAPSEPDAILRTTSADAAYWHREVGSRR